MKVKTDSWHYKMATGYSDLYYDYRCWRTPPTSCRYFFHVFEGMFIFFFTEIVAKFILPIAFDFVTLIAIATIGFLIMTGDFLGILSIVAYLLFYAYIVTIVSSEVGRYIGPLCILRDVKLFRKIVDKTFKPIEIVDVKEKS